jgi:trimeric autotransporter adhesin
MPSQIDPRNIVDAFPLEGKNNPSQVFRDNFNIIKFNLRTASLEITDLQNRATPVNADWSAQTGLAVILNKPEIPPLTNIIAGENVVVEATDNPNEFIISSTGGGGDGEAYDQQLNTFNDVEFNSVSTGEYTNETDQSIVFKVKTTDAPAWHITMDSLNTDGTPEGDCYISSTVVDILGNSYSMGAQGNEGFPFVMKVSPSGEVIWIKELQMAPGYRGYSSGDSIALDSQNNVICGFMIDNAFEIGFLVKLTNNGDVLWSRTIDYQDLTQPEDYSTPTGTLWNTDGWSVLNNLTTRSYVPFVFAMWSNIGNNIVNKELIMKFTTSTNENRYYKIKFTSWGQGNAGGGAFTYERQRIDPSTGLPIGSTVTFSKPALADPFTVFDEIVPGELRISRGDNEFIFNTVVDSESDWGNPRALRRDPITSITTDSNNNIYALVYVTYWPVTGNEGVNLIKFNSTGTVQWKKDIEVAVNIPYHSTDANGDSYVIVGWGDQFVYKINTNGDVVWSKKIATTGSFPRGIIITTDSTSVYICSRIDAGGPVILKLDKITGNIIWSKLFSQGGGSVYCNGLETDNENVYILAANSDGCFYSTISKNTGEVIKTFSIPNLDIWWYWTGKNLALSGNNVYLSGYSDQGIQYAEMFYIPKDPTDLGVFGTLDYSTVDFSYTLSEDDIPPVTNSSTLVSNANAYANVFEEIVTISRYTSDEWISKLTARGELELPGYKISGAAGNSGDLLVYEDGIASWKPSPLKFDSNRNFIFNDDSTPISSVNSNIAIGYQSQINNIDQGIIYGYGETVSVGNYTLTNNRSGANTAIGTYALQNNTTGVYNTALGYQAGINNNIGNFNLFLGTWAGRTNTTGNFNVSLGYFSSYSNTIGTANTIVGSNAARIGSSISFTTAVGFQSLEFLTTGSNNTAIGVNALRSTTTGFDNTAVGLNSLLSNTSGIRNTSIGSSSLSSNTTGTRNTAVGVNSLTSNNFGYDNTAVGDEALRSNTSGYRNTAIGVDALDANSTGYSNTSVGVSSMQANTTGYSNTAVGDNSLFLNTTGYNNTAVGMSSIRNNTTGFDLTAVGNSALNNNTSGSRNVAIGRAALFSNTIGIRNVAVGMNANQANTSGNDNTSLGDDAMLSTTTGYRNVAIGSDALEINTIGYGNTAIGTLASRNISSGFNNTTLGDSAGSNITTGSNNIVIGFNAQPVSATTSNSITLGNSSITSLRCQVTSITSLSDARDKTDIESLNYGLDFVNRLNPVKFTWNTRDGAKVGIKSSGFIAQDLKQVQEETGAKDYLNLVLDENPDKLEATYGNLIPVLVKAIQELTAEVNELKKKIKE